jgi:hypothetical protein
MSATNISDCLTGLDDPLRETGGKLRPVIDGALFTYWLCQARDLESR